MLVCVCLFVVHLMSCGPGWVVFWGCLKRSLCGYAAGGRDMDAGGSDGGPETSRWSRACSCGGVLGNAWVKTVPLICWWVVAHGPHLTALTFLYAGRVAQAGWLLQYCLGAAWELEQREEIYLKNKLNPGAAMPQRHAVSRSQGVAVPGGPHVLALLEKRVSCA